MKKDKIKKIIISLVTCIFVMNINLINTLALESDLDAGGSSNDSGTNKNPGANTSGGGSNSWYGTQNNPIPIYEDGLLTNQMHNYYQNFLDNSTEEGIKESVYPFVQSGYDTPYYDLGTGKWYQKLMPIVKFKKQTRNVIKTESIVTNYYRWNCTGGENWELQGGQYQSVSFSKVGTYTVTAIQNKTKTTSSQMIASSSLVYEYPNGHVKRITGNDTAGEKSYTQKTYDDQNTFKKWVFEIHPEEVGLIIVPERDFNKDLAKPDLEAVLIE